MLHPVQHGIQPRQRILLDTIDWLKAKLTESPVGDVAQILFDLVGLQPFDTAHFEGEIDEGVLVLDNGLANTIEATLQRVGPKLRILLDKSSEQTDD